MSEDDVRETLDALIRKSGEDYASVSRMLGRNPTYIQQFVKRGVPRRLREEDRVALARHFNVPETMLGARPQPSAPVVLQVADVAAQMDFVLVPALDLRALAGRGPPREERMESPTVAFKASWVRQLASGGIDALSVMRVEGDSMQPTLNHGDQILFDTNDKLDRIRDGIYVLRVDGALLVKRIAVNPSTRKLSILSDNPAYPSWRECDLDSVSVLGRVVWVGRRLG